VRWERKTLNLGDDTRAAGKKNNYWPSYKASNPKDGEPDEVLEGLEGNLLAKGNR